MEKLSKQSIDVSTKLFINLVPIKDGGGLQNGINLIKGLKPESIQTSISAVFRRNELLKQACEDKGIHYKQIGTGLLSRLLFEMLFFVNIKNGIIFTLFGGRPLITAQNTNIVGCAYSNLFYPEINFWCYLPNHKKIIKKLIDKYRLWAIMRSDVVIFETEILRKRAVEQKLIPFSRTHVVKMAVSEFVRVYDSKKDQCNNYRFSDKSFKILYLANPHPNKRIHLLPEVAYNLRKSSTKSITFILTLSNSNYTSEVFKLFKHFEVENYFKNIGRVAPDLIANLISDCDAMINIALLESFSNNFIEAWQMQRPLIATDADWARDAAKGSALYVNPMQPEIMAKKLVRIASDAELKNTLIAEGKKLLLSYNSAQSKTDKYIDIIKKVYER